MAKQRITAEMKAFLPFLQKMEAADKSFSATDIAKATEYELKGSIKAKLSRDEWRNILVRLGPDEFKASGTIGLNDQEFAKKVSVKSMLHAPQSTAKLTTLSERLYLKAKENFILALELYNRPSLLNRLESFAMLHCAAWEQLLKGRLVEKNGEKFIFRKDGRSKNLSECCEAIYAQRSNRVWKNLEMIADLRNMSTHLVMPELGIAYSPIFQAGVVNFLRAYREFVSDDPIPSHAVGLLTLTTGAKGPTAVDLAVKYGQELGEQISAMIDQVSFQIEADAHPEFAIIVKHQMRFGSGGDVDFTLEQLLAQDGRVAIIEKVRDASGDLLPGQVVAEVNRMLKEQLPVETRRDIFTYKGKVSDEMNSTDFQVLCDDQGWKKSDNEYHHTHGPLQRGTFTIRCVHWIVGKLKTQNDYLSKRKESYMERMKKTRKTKKR